MSLEHRGYIAGPIDFDASDATFSGTVAGIRDVIHFEGSTAEELRQASAACAMFRQTPMRRAGRSRARLIRKSPMRSASLSRMRENGIGTPNCAPSPSNGAPGRVRR